MDAALIARFCSAMKPEIWIPPSTEIRSLRALVRRVDSLIDMCSQEKNRMSTAHESVLVMIKEHIVYLNQEIEKIRKQIADLIKRNPHLKQRKELLDSIPGLGKATIPHILADLDDFDKFTHVREMVAFIGLAPKEILSGSSIKGKPRLCKTGIDYRWKHAIVAHQMLPRDANRLKGTRDRTDRDGGDNLINRKKITAQVK
jgi:transposase